MPTTMSNFPSYVDYNINGKFAVPPEGTGQYKT